jgi:hypothetical protein
MSKKVAILQSNYIPWKGYFDIINMVDVFVIYDDVQYTKRDWRNRNIIKTANGLSWLTVPVEVKGRYSQKINEVIVSDNRWIEKHLKSLKINYSKSAYFKLYNTIIENIYYNSPKKNLAEINFHFLKSIMNILGIQTEIKFSTELEVTGEKTERLVKICKKLDADVYLSGPVAKNYMQIDEFTKENIKVEWMDYSSYPEYNQLFPPFEHKVTILDLIFNEGPNVPKFMKSLQ